MPSRLRRFSSATDSSANRPQNRPDPGRDRRPPHGRRCARRCAAGFSLLEVLVALAILGIGLGVVFQGFSQGLRLRGESADSVRLSLAAERLLGQLIEREAAPTQPEEGEDSGCHWRLEPVAGSVPAGGATSASSTTERRGAALVAVRLSVTAPSGRSWEAATLLPEAKDTVK